MNHDEFLAEVDSLEPNALLSSAAREHAAHCPSCAARYHRVFEAHKALASLAPELPPGFEEAVMRAIRAAARPASMMALRDWVVTLFLIFAAVAVIPFGEGFSWARSLFGASYLLPLMLTMSIALAVFCMVFVGTHIDTLRLALPSGRKRK